MAVPMIRFTRQTQERETASQTIESLRSKSPSYLSRKSILAAMLYDFANKNIEFISWDGRAFIKPLCIPFPIEINVDCRAFQNVARHYSLTPGEKVFDLITSDLIGHAEEHGARMKIRRFSHYDVAKNTLFLSNRGQNIIRITPTTIDVVPNGTEGVLFFEPNQLDVQPISFLDDPETEEAFREVIIESINFSEQGCAISKAYQQRIFEVYLLSIYFPEILPSRPILVLAGDKGSGKTSALRQVGRLIYGPSFEVRLLSDNPAEFDVAVTNESFVVFDNVDSRSRWLEDKLAACATGGSISKRKLFTTNEQQVFSVDARIALTARTPNFRREDVSERLIILRVERFKAFKPEYELKQELDRKEDRIFSGLCFTLQGVLKAFEETRSFHYLGQMRLADFASFFMRIGISRGEEKEAKEALASLLSEQQAFSVEENKLFDLLQDWIADDGEIVSPLPTAEMYKSLKAYASEKGQEFTHIAKSTISLGKQLSELSRLTDSPLSITAKELGGRRKAWTIQRGLDK